jgi:hypothetical protein
VFYAVHDITNPEKPSHFEIELDEPGHLRPEEERVVEERAGYMVVEKVGRAGERAAELDPRKPGT